VRNVVLCPEYYKDFKCISHLCKHNCCIGWEIDIDADTLKFYKSVSGEFGDRLKQNIEYSSEPHFKLQTGDRCPFLNHNGLCDIITTLGEDALCQICSDHPRFRNFYTSFTEIGLGLCCEEAARIIFSHEKPFRLVALDGEKTEICHKEKEFLKLRQEIFDIAEREDISALEKIEVISKTYKIQIPKKTNTEWLEFLKSLERLDPDWESYLSLPVVGVEELSKVNLQSFEKYFSRLLVYFIYRHLGEGVYDGRIKERIRLGLICTYLIRILTAAQITQNLNFGFEDFIELCRSFSAEIEYSNENIGTILNL
jgi:lysine-N-methylase